MAEKTDSHFLTAVLPESSIIKPHVYKIEDSKPPTTFDDPFSPLPPTVEFSRIISNVVSSLAKNHGKERESTIEKWLRYLSLSENQAVVSDCFWYAICKLFHTDKYPKAESSLQKRIADNFIALTLSIEDKTDNQMFFKQYFDLLSQSVFYAFFYAFPKSRSNFDDALKTKLFKLFSKIFTGVEICCSGKYIDKWTLDLGTGNILNRNKKPQEVRESKSLQPMFKEHPRTKKREQLGLRYSPIVELYLKNHDYKTRNYVPEYKMRFSKLDANSEQIQNKFKVMQQEANRILAWANEQKEQNEAAKERLESEIKMIKKQTLIHNRRLDKRKNEELERGAHEYANYLVSLLNAGITMTSLGVVRRNLN